MSEKNSKIIRDFCYNHGIKENKRFDSKVAEKRFKSLNRKSRIKALNVMISDLIRWSVPKYLEINIKRTGPLNVF